VGGERPEWGRSKDIDRGCPLKQGGQHTPEEWDSCKDRKTQSDELENDGPNATRVTGWLCVGGWHGRALSERQVNAFAQHSCDHSDHRAWLNDFAGILRRVASRRENTLWIDGGNAVADEHGVVSEYHDRPDGERSRGTKFKSIALLNCRHHARGDDTGYDYAVQERQLKCVG